MIWLYFNSESDAQIALNTINSRLNIPNGNTQTWARIHECVNGTWAFIKPNCDLSGLPDHTEKTYNKEVDLGLPNGAEDAETK